MNTPAGDRKQKALALMQSGRLAEARTLLEQACSADRRDTHAWYLCAAVNHELGDFVKAVKYYRHVIALEPRNAEAHYFLGEAYLALENLVAAEDAYRRAIALRPGYIEAYCNLGITQERLGQYAKAAQSYEAALRLDPASSLLHYNLANMLRWTGHADGAVTHYQQATKLNPGFVQAYSNFGDLLGDLGRTSEALACYEAALQADPHSPDVHNNLGLVLERLDRLDDAISHYRQVLHLNPNHVVTLVNLGAALADQGKYEDATACYRQALAIQPDHTEALNNLGNALTCQRRFKDAITCFTRALELRPDYAEARTNLGYAYQHLGFFGEALACYQQAVADDPDYAEGHFNLSLMLLQHGEFEKGWQEYAWRWKRKRARPRPFPHTVENGRNLNGQDVFVYGEQGLGDELFFMRFLPWLKSAGGGKIIFLPSAKLFPILRDVPLIDRLVNADGNPAPGDAVISIGDIPRLFHVKGTSQTPSPLKLTPRLEQVETVRHRLAQFGPPPYIGVTWRAGIKKRNALYKEISPTQMAGIFQKTAATMLVLQRAPAAGEIDQFATALGRPVHDLSALNDDLESMLALLALIDEYVGVSNTNMHLRAGVGKTARVLVPAPPEWRWMAEGKESPWFPGFTVYRQGYDGSWEGAFDMLTADLQHAYGR